MDHNYFNTVAANEVARLEAEWKAERDAADAAERAAADAQATAWRNAVAPMAVACGVRPFCLEAVVERAATVFELRDGRLVAKPATVHTNRRLEMKKVSSPIRPTSGTGGGVKSPPSNKHTVHHVKGTRKK
jgi:hypothetical protein